MNRAQIWLFIFGVIVCFEVPENLGYDGGLIFYDLKTNQKLLPPVVTASKYGDNIRLPFLGQPCSCEGSQCGCCAGMKIEAFDFHQKMCANVTVSRRDLEVKMDVFLNDRNVIMYKLSALNPPPFCIPVLLVVPVNLCMKVYDIYTIGTNVHLCMNWIVKVLSNDVFVLHFNCVKMGTDGVEFIKPGQEQITQNLLKPDEQVDSHIYDPVDLDRRRSMRFNHISRT